MSDLHMIKPPQVTVSAEASAGHRMIGPVRTDNKPAGEPRAPLPSNMRRAAGQFGAATGVQINRRGEPPVTPIVPQVLRALESMLGNLTKHCEAQKATRATKTARDALTLVRAIANGQSIADAPPAKDEEKKA
jgi:hypothetical protein